MNEELLIRFLTHRCTSVEIREVDTWVAADPANADWLFEMERVWSLKDELRFSDKEEIEKAYARFVTGLQQEVSMKPLVRERSFSLSWIKYVAAIFIIGLLSANLYWMFDEKKAGVNIVEVPNGQRVSLILSDGTKVWLNSHSKLVYPTEFTSKKRNVRLEGEGFFEVTHNEKAPFTVQTDLVQIRVLGTKFNVKSYESEPSSVLLTEGKVEVATNDHEQKVTLKPHDQVTYSKIHGLKISHNVDADVVKSWISGEAAYMNKRLDEIANELERKFDVHIDIQDSVLASEIFTCRFKETATIEQVLVLLKETRQLDYEAEGNQIRIYKPLK